MGAEQDIRDKITADAYDNLVFKDAASQLKTSEPEGRVHVGNE